MREFQSRKSNSSHPWKYRIVSVILVIILVLLGRGVWGLVKKNHVARENYDKAESKFIELKAEHDRLLATLTTLKTGRGIEAEIRKNFSVAKEGERLITIVDVEPATSTKEVDSDSWWKHWFDWF